MKKTGFIFSVHNHQPFGNFDDVIESCFRRSYRPLIDTLASNPFVRTVLHISGPLLIWMNQNHKEHIEKIRRLVEKDQIELLGGSYSEAILSTLPEEDRILQINKYKNLVKEVFSENITLNGFWLTERVWTPDIVRTLSNSGYIYTFVDETHIKKAGNSSEDHIFITRYLDHSLYLFPINRFLRYDFPFKDSDEIIKKIKGKDIVIHADDGEKFGDWPGMYDYLYKDKRLSRLLCDIQDEDIEFIFPQKLIEDNQHPKEIFIPYSSYDSMNKWSMNTDTLIRLYREYDRERINANDSLFYTGNFFNFFIKYPESGLIYKKNLFFSSLFHHDDDIKNELLRSQCCCGYWHGVFGGIYLPHMRDAINLGNIYAEKALPEGISRIDDELILLKDKNICATINKTGGVLESIDCFDNSLNIINTISRKPEFYHSDVREPIYYDLDRRTSASEYIVSDIIQVEDYLKNNYGIQGNFKNKEFHLLSSENKKIILKANEKCLISDQIKDIELSKTYYFENDYFCIELDTSASTDINSGYIMTELNFHNVYRCVSNEEAFKTDKIRMTSEKHGDIEILLSRELHILNLQINTVSLYHQKKEEILQSNTIVIFIPLSKGHETIRLKKI